MGNRFTGRGNMGAVPTLKHVEIDGESRPVADLRIYFDRPVPDGEGGFEDRGGFWLDVSLWGAKALAAAQILPKGARVSVSGTLAQHVWTDSDSGEERSRIELRADHVDLDLARVEQVGFRKRDEDGVTDDTQEV